MAVSAETQAIIDTLKAEGDLIRNSGTNSVRSVKIQMDRFEGLFASINDNLIQQTSILTSQLSAAEKAARQAETRRQYEELTPPGAENRPAATGRDAMEQRISQNIDNKLKDFSMLGAIKSLALGAAGAFIGYNLLKGGIDEATGGGFTRFEEGILNFGKQLSEISLPDITSTMSELQVSVAGLTTTINDLKKMIDEIDLGDIIYKVGLAFTGLGTLLTGIRLWAYNRQKASEARAKADYEKHKAETRRMYDDFRQYLEDMKANPNRAGGFDTSPYFDPKVDTGSGTGPVLPKADSGIDGGRTGPVLPESPTGDFRPKIGGAAGALDTAKRYMGFTPDLDMKDPNVRSQLRTDFMERFGTAEGYTQTQKGVVRGPDGKFTADDNLLERMTNSMDAKYSKWFRRAVKAAGILGIALTAYELYVIYLIFTDPNSTDLQKKKAIGGFLGSLVGAAGLGAAMALAGAPFGGWTGLITGVIGLGLGAVAGGMIGEYVAEWIFENEPDAKHFDRQRELEMQYYEKLSGMTSQEAIDYFANSNSVGSDPLMRFLDPSYNNAYNPRTGYESGMDAQNMITPRLDFKTSPRRGYESGMDAMNELPRYLQGASYIPGGGSRTALLQRASAGGGMMGNVIINAPQNVSPVVNNVEGGKSISHVQVANFGGGGGFGMGKDDPYNLSFV